MLNYLVNFKECYFAFCFFLFNIVLLLTSTISDKAIYHQFYYAVIVSCRDDFKKKNSIRIVQQCEINNTKITVYY